MLLLLVFNIYVDSGGQSFDLVTPLNSSLPYCLLDYS